MPLDRLSDVLERRVARLEEQGTAKGREVVVRRVLRPEGGRGPRFLLEGEGDRAFIRMNSNSYLGLGLHPDVIGAEEAAARGSWERVRERSASSSAPTVLTSSWSGHWPASTDARRG